MLFLFPHVLQCPTHQVMYLRDVQSLILFVILLPTLLSHSECDSGPGDESNKARLPPHSNNLGQQLQRREFSRKYKLPPGLSPLWKQVDNYFCQKILLKLKGFLFNSPDVGARTRWAGSTKFRGAHSPPRGRVPGPRSVCPAGQCQWSPGPELGH